MGIDHCLLQNVAVRDARPNTDHYLVLGCFRRAASDTHLCYLRKQTCLPIRPPKTPDGVDRLFSELRGGITKLPWWERPCKEWISPKTWHLIDTRIAARWHKVGAQQISRTLRRKIKASLQEG